jgi:16S rRNA (guanine527-N7)-methyltransferase
VDKAILKNGAQKLLISLSEDQIERLLAFAEELLKWNKKINLTAITQPQEVIEKHLLDSLLAAPFVHASETLLDFGSGAGLPGIPLAIVLPNLQATLVDSVDKKVAFMKTGAVKGRVANQVKCVHVHLGGNPEQEKLSKVNTVISRAFMDVARFIPLAKPYVIPGGQIVAMLGQSNEKELKVQATAHQVQLVKYAQFELPFSGEPRAIAVFHVEH